MDENLQNINLLSFEKHSPNDHFRIRTTNFRAINLQRPFASNLPSGPAAYSRYASHVPPPATMLTLNTTHETHFFRNTDHLVENQLVHQQTVPQICPHFSLPVDFSHNTKGKKRHQEIDSNNSDRRHKRMIKNRDAAARSRARKQAYTDELELEVAYLLEENARLRKQQKQVCLAATAQQPQKHKFCRATSAPL